MDEKEFLLLSFDRMSRMTDAEIEASRDYADSVKQFNRTKDLEAAINFASIFGTGGAGITAKLSGTVLSGELRLKLVYDVVELAWDAFNSVLDGTVLERSRTGSKADEVIFDADFIRLHREASFPYTGAPANALSSNFDGNPNNDNTGRMTIAQAQKLYQVQKSTGWLDKTPSERSATIETANSMKPSAKKFANDPGGDGLGPGSRDGGNSLPSGRPDRDQQGGGSSGSGGNSGAPGNTKPSSTGSGSLTKTVNTPTGPKQVDPKSTYGSNNTKHYEQVSNGKVKSGLPVALDLDGDGMEVSFFTNAAFDFDGDGYRERTAWVAPDDGLLVIDLNADGTRGAGDGKIDQTKEVVLAAWGAAGSTDLQALAEARDDAGNLIFDTNGDGQLTAADASYAEFRVWQDKDQDGVVDEGELATLAEAGITQIGLRYDDGSAFTETSDDKTVGHATLKGVASFVRNGKVITGGVGDLALGFNEDGYRIVETADGFLVEFETGETLVHRTLRADEQNLDLGGDASNIVSATGNSGNNLLDGRAKTAAILLSGGAGADTILGGAGDDLLVGGAGRDAMHGGAGHDVIYADAEDVFFLGGVAQITGGEGYDRLVLSADASFSEVDIDALGFEAVELSDGANIIAGLKEDVDYLLDGRGGADNLAGAGGDDILLGGSGNDSLIGNAGKDRLFGEDGNDFLDGGDGEDVLAGGKGADTLRGGAGDDLYLYQRGDGTDVIHDQAFGTYMERYTYHEAIAYTYTEAVAYTYVHTSVSFGGKRSTYVNELRTGYRMEQRTGYRNEERSGYRSVYGEVDGGIDTLQFGNGVRIEDLLLSRSGADMVIRLRDDANADQLDVGDQITIVDWADQKNRIETFALSDGTKLDVSQILHGQAGFGAADVLIGTAEGDFLSGGNGADTIHAGAGRDIASGGAGADVISGGAGKDFLFGGSDNDTINGGEDDDYLIGGTGADHLVGDVGNDALAGEAGNDLLQGGSGNDLLLGGTGNDTLEGGAGDDTYFFFRGDGHDLIHDHHSVPETVQEATGRMLYQRSGKSGTWVAEMRTVTRMAQRDGGYDKLQFGYAIGLEDLFAETTGSDLRIGIRDLADPTKGVTAMSDIVTIKDWANAMNRIERFDLGDGQSLDMSQVVLARSGLAASDALSGSAGGDFLSGGHGHDSLTGFAGKDYLVGGAGNDRLDGGDGEDDLFGGAGQDAFVGGEGIDYLFGGSGHDSLEGGNGNDVLAGGSGDDLLKGGRGNDVYIFNRGDGHDRIDESAWEQVQETFSYTTGNMIAQRVGSGKGATTIWVNEVRTGTRTHTRAVEGGEDVLQFGKGIDVADLMMRMTSSDLVIELTPIEAGTTVTDSVTVTSWTSPEFRVETLRFANGFVVDIRGIETAQSGSGAEDQLVAVAGRASWLGGQAGNDSLTGSTLADILMGGAGADSLQGGLGDDTYIFGRGDGSDVIIDAGSSAVGTDPTRPGGDKLLFGPGVTVEDLVLQRVGNDLRVYVGEDTEMTRPLEQIADSITIQNWATASSRVEVFQFFDGMDFDFSGLTNTYLGADLLGAGTSAPVNDALSGSSAADWMDGFAGHDTLVAGAGDDFVLGRNGNDRLEGGDGADVISGGAGHDALFGGNQDDVMSGGAGNDLVQGDAGNDAMLGGLGDDTLNGGDGNDVILGDHGNDTFIASRGKDVYRFGFGDGQDTYFGSTDASIRGTDVFQFEADIDRKDLWFEHVDNDLWVRLLGADDRISFKNWFHSTNPSAYVEGFQAGSSFLSFAKVQSLVDAMKTLTPNTGDTAYGVTAEELPQSVANAIEAAWQNAA